MHKNVIWLIIIGSLIILSGVIVYKIQERIIYGPKVNSEEVIQTFKDKQDLFDDIAQVLIRINSDYDIEIGWEDEKMTIDSTKAGKQVIYNFKNLKEDLERLLLGEEIWSVRKLSDVHLVSFYIVDPPEGYRMRFIYNPENVLLGDGEVTAINEEWVFMLTQLD